MKNKIKNHQLAICLLLAMACCDKKEMASKTTDKKTDTVVVS